MQHFRADENPINLDKVNAFFKKKLIDVRILTNQEETGIIYCHKGKTLYSGNDSIACQQATYHTPAQYVDYPHSILIQAWTAHGWYAIKNYMPWWVKLITDVGITIIVLIGLRHATRLITQIKKKKNHLIRIDWKQNICYIEKEAYKLANLDLRLIDLLYQAKGHSLTREKIMLTLWNTINDSTNTNLNTHISNLRKILKLHEGYDLITHKGKGYTLVMPE